MTRESDVPGPAAPDSEEEWLELPADPELFFAEIQQRGWGDGLPVIPPTEERLGQHLTSWGGDPQQVIGVVPPDMREATPAKIAANAIMAGCQLGSLPVLVAAVQAMLDPSFNLSAVQTTTHPVAPLLVVSGPAVEQLGVSSGAGLFGPGHRANATIGRALRLALINLGGARVGESDRATQGQPSKFSFCIAENVEASPWQPYSAESWGVEAGVSAVTVFAGEGPHNVNDHGSVDASGILTTVASTLATLGGNPAYCSRGEVFIVLGPEHAATVAASGFARTDVQSLLFEWARSPVARLKRGGQWANRTWEPWIDALTECGDESAMIPIVSDPQRIHVLVAGGPGKHSAVLPGFALSRAVTHAVQVRSEEYGEDSDLRSGRPGTCAEESPEE